MVLRHVSRTYEDGYIPQVESVLYKKHHTAVRHQLLLELSEYHTLLKDTNSDSDSKSIDATMEVFRTLLEGHFSHGNSHSNAATDVTGVFSVAAVQQLLSSGGHMRYVHVVVLLCCYSYWKCCCNIV